MCSVTHRPPKKKAPSKAPASKAKARAGTSLIRVLLHFLIFRLDPKPGSETADDQAEEKEHQRPRERARIVRVDPDTERRADQGRYHHRPADHPRQAQAEPDALVGAAPRLQLARRLGPGLPAERCLLVGAVRAALVIHVEIP